MTSGLTSSPARRQTLQSFAAANAFLMPPVGSLFSKLKQAASEATDTPTVQVTRTIGLTQKMRSISLRTSQVRSPELTGPGPSSTNKREMSFGTTEDHDPCLAVQACSVE